jgi:hypothetical protein
MKKSFLSYLVIVVAILIATPFVSLASTPPPGPPQAVPLDPLSWVLLASGGAIGAKKYYDYKKSKSTEE